MRIRPGNRASAHDARFAKERLHEFSKSTGAVAESAKSRGLVDPLNRAWRTSVDRQPPAPAGRNGSSTEATQFHGSGSANGLRGGVNGRAAPVCDLCVTEEVLSRSLRDWVCGHCPRAGGRVSVRLSERTDVLRLNRDRGGWTDGSRNDDPEAVRSRSHKARHLVAARRLQESRTRDALAVTEDEQRWPFGSEKLEALIWRARGLGGFRSRRERAGTKRGTELFRREDRKLHHVPV